MTLKATHCVAFLLWELKFLSRWGYLGLTGYTQLVMKWFVWLLLLGAIGVRLFLLAEIPSGLTHDEADHGISAWEVVEGERPLYFTIGYGREPLYDYLTAGVMAGIGKTYLAGRLVSVWLGWLLLPLMFIWVKRVWGWQTAVILLMLLAFCFWPVMSSRQMLRSVALPTLFLGAVMVWWQLLYPEKKGNRRERGERREGTQIGAIRVNRFGHILLAGVLLGATFYTYIPARALWLAFPLAIGYSWLTHHDKLRWQETGLMLLVAGLVGLPLFWYLQTTPTAEVRIGQLSAPLTQAMDGEFGLLLQNIQAGLGALVWHGDSAWRYNVAERPFLILPFSFLFIVGLLSASWHVLERNGQTAVASFFVLTWFGIGLAPVLITGPDLSMTQGVGMQPALYLLVALGGWQLVSVAKKWVPPILAYGGLCLLLLIGIGGDLHSYFVVWGNHPEVRVQYETTMMEAMHHINQHDVGAVTVSTITPHPYHTPALAEMVLWQEEEIAWVDGRSALLWQPTPRNTLLQPAFAPITAFEPRLRPAIQQEIILPLRPDDIDSPLTVYQFDGARFLQQLQAEMTPQQAEFGEAMTLIGTLPIQFKEGETGTRMLTLWRIHQPLPHAVLFTQMIPDGGDVLAQADLLGTDGRLWREGDILLQMHILPSLAFEPLYVGVYTCPDGDCTKGTTRLPINGDPAQTALRIER